LTSRWVFLTALAFLWSAFGVAGAQKTDKASGSAKQQVISLNGTDSGKLVSAKVGREIMITLQTIGPGEYAAPRVSSASIRFGSEPRGPKQVYRFIAAVAGQGKLAIPHTGNNPTYQITIQVTPN